MLVNVLIVEDNPVARSFLCRVVRDSFSDAMEIIEAGDLDGARRRIGPAAVSLPDRPADPAPARTFQLILIDLELPDGNGMALLAELGLRRYPATRIVTTLYSDDDHLFPALQCGADGYLLKEDRFEVLVEELQKIVRGQPPLSPAIARRLLTHFRGGGVDGSTVPTGAPHASPSQLTPRETEVLTQLSKGFTVKEIAGLMGIKWLTINDQIKSIYRKVKLSSRADVAVLKSRQDVV